MLTSEKSAIDVQVRVSVARWIALFFFLICISRLWYLQVVRGEYFRDKSENNRLRTVYITPPRGFILDRHGKVLVKNRPSFNIELVVEDCPNPTETIQKLAVILNEDPQKISSRLKDNRKRLRFEPRILLKDVTRDQVAKVVARSHELPGVAINYFPARNYLFGDFAAHTLGYIREINKNQLQDARYSDYRPGDVVGQYGIEKTMDHFLNGTRGVQRVVVNADGVRIEEYSFEEEKPGHSVTLTIDYDVQKAADEALQDKKGAIVALNPKTGEIYAISSAPRFDPNVFSGELSSETWRNIISSPDKPMNNRVVQGGYPPGSVFKIIMAAAGASERVINFNEQVNCPGYLKVGSRRFRCHKEHGHGLENLVDAIVESCDVYFYTVGQRLGIDRIHNYATQFGLGQVTGLDLVEELRGLVPSTEWKRRYFKKPEDQKWYPGETPSVAIGQGALIVTPLQMTRAVAAMINGGKLYRPWLIKEVKAEDGRVVDDSFSPEVMGTIDVEEDIVQQVLKGMEGVVNFPNGTAARARLPKELDILVGGKTGTAQMVSLNISDKSKKFDHHAWFVGYAPIEDPKIIVGVIIENGGHGGATAAPLAQKVLLAYFNKRHK